MGAVITMGDNWIEASASPEARLRGRLNALDADLNHIPDAAMTAACSPFMPVVRAYCATSPVGG